MRFVGFGVILVAAIAQAIFGWNADHARGQTPAVQDVTYQATLSTAGEVVITFTPDLSGVIRAGLRDARFDNLPPSFQSDVLSSREYYNPPVNVTGGNFIVSVPLSPEPPIYETTKYEELHINGSLVDGQISGTVAWVLCNRASPPDCSNMAPSMTFAEGSVFDAPPRRGDLLYTGHFEGLNGDVTLSTDSSGGVTSFVINNVIVSSCFDPPITLSIHFFYDPPVSSDQHIVDPIRSLPSAFLSNSAHVDGDTASGTLIVPDGFPPHCQVSLSWSAQRPAAIETQTLTPTAPTTPKVSVSLPATGSEGDRPARSPQAFVLLLAAFAAAGAALFFVAAAFGRRVR